MKHNFIFKRKYMFSLIRWKSCFCSCKCCVVLVNGIFKTYLRANILNEVIKLLVLFQEQLLKLTEISKCWINCKWNVKEELQLKHNLHHSFTIMKE